MRERCEKRINGFKSRLGWIMITLLAALIALWWAAAAKAIPLFGIPLTLYWLFVALAILSLCNIFFNFIQINGSLKGCFDTSNQRYQCDDRWNALFALHTEIGNLFVIAVFLTGLGITNVYWPGFGMAVIIAASAVVAYIIYKLSLLRMELEGIKLCLV